jgi:surfeit locus 1 family protein
MTRAAFPIAMTITVVLALAILLTLGTWQVKRLAWKTDLLAKIEASKTAAALPLEQVLHDRAKEDAAYARVVAVCPGLATAPFAELYAVKEGQAGVRLISLCPMAASGFDAILVDRGFVADTVSARPAVQIDDPRPSGVRGVLRRGEARTFVTPPDDPIKRRFFARDLAAIAAALGAKHPAPYFLMAETSSNPDLKTLVPAPTPTNVPNSHLGYAITWYGLAAALVGVYLALLRRWARTEAA